MIASSLCEAYHWTLEDVRKLTLPQIILMNHAAFVNRENSERRYEAKRKSEENLSSESKRVKEMKGKELTDYLTSSWG